MGNNFSAASLESTKSSIRNQVEEIVSTTNQLGNTTASISGLVSAGSSSLAGSWSSISSTYRQIGSTIESSVDELLTELTNYVNETLANEMSNQTKLSQVNESLSDLKSRISSL